MIDADSTSWALSGLPASPGCPRKRRPPHRRRSRSVIPSSAKSRTTRTSRAGRPRSIPSSCGCVSGYLDKVNFKEGALVKKGDVLFEIDPRTYQADLERAQGNVAQMRPACATGAPCPRAKNLLVAIGQEEYDRYESDYREAAANLDVAKANRDLAVLDLDYTKVTAPVSGRQPLHRHRGQPGSVGRPDRRHPAHHDRVGGPDVRLLRRGRAHSAARPAVDPRRQGQVGRETELPVSLGLANEDGFPHQGTINFIDNQVNPKTGTLRVRGVFPNKDECSPRAFSPASGCPSVEPTRPCWSPTAPRHRPGAEDRLRRGREERGGLAPVRLGALHDGLREITEGLKPGERVIVNGLQQVRPGVTVEPKLVDMPVRLAASTRKSERS